jgi:hypothetical protein
MTTTFTKYPTRESLRAAVAGRAPTTHPPIIIPAAQLEYTTTELQKFVNSILELGDGFEIRILPAGESRWCKVRDIVSLIPWMVRANQHGQNVYCGINPRPDIGSKGDDCIAVARCLCADFDGVGAVDALRRIESLALPRPTVTLNSGHGSWTYWRLTEPMMDLKRWSRLQRDLATLLGSDCKICNPERIARLPGFINHKPPVADATLFETDAERTHELEKLASLIPDAATDDKPLASPVPTTISTGNRNSMLTSLAGTMRRRGMDQTSIEAALISENVAKCDPPLSEYEVMGIVNSVQRYKPMLALATKKELISASDFLPFPINTLPSPIADFVREEASALVCDQSAIALILLAALASAIGNSRRVRVRAGWSEPCILWVMLVAVTGSKKTPLMMAAMQFVLAQQQKLRAGYDLLLRDYNTALAEWNAKSKDQRPAEKPEKPRFPHVLTSDTTTEGLAAMLEFAPRGLILYRDELSAWLRSFNQYRSGGGDEQSYLSLYNASFLKIDRKNAEQPTLYVPSAAVTIAGGIQPGVLREAFTPDRFLNGLASRFVFTFPPEPDGPAWTSAEVAPDTLKAIGDIFDFLYALHLEKGEPIHIPLCPEAALHFGQFADALKKERKSMGDVPLAGAWAKFEALPARLALVLELVNDAIRGFPPPPSEIQYIQPHTMRSALTITQWLMNETRRVYAMLGCPSKNLHQSLLDWVRQHGGKVTPRQLKEHSRRFPTSDEAELALGELVTAGHGKWEVSASGNRGRPSRHFTVTE